MWSSMSFSASILNSHGQSSRSISLHCPAPSSSPKTRAGPHILTQAQADDIKARLDDILDELERTYPDKLRGLLPRIYAGSNLDRENVTALINSGDYPRARARRGPRPLLRLRQH